MTPENDSKSKDQSEQEIAPEPPVTLRREMVTISGNRPLYNYTFSTTEKDDSTKDR